MSEAPYFNTFDKNDNFLSVMIKPGFGVQARELNELQSILQNQISNIGDFLFENGQRVINGETDILPSVHCLKFLGVLANRDSFKTINHITNGLKSKVVATYTDGSDTFVFVTYLNSADDNVTNTFVTGNLIDVEFTVNNVTVSNQLTVADTSYGSIATIKSGIFYVNGYFVLVNDQFLVISTNQTVDDVENIEIGLLIKKDIITSESNINLLDPAFGAPSYGAPGADRLKYTAELILKDNVTNLNQFLKIISLKNGNVVTEVRTTDYSVINEILAQRTYDESGDYTVDDFMIDVRDHLDNGSNRGVYPAPTGDANKIAFVLDPGVAYVRGFKIQTQGNTYLETDRARTTGNVSEFSLDTNYNTYVVSNDLSKLPQFGALITFKDNLNNNVGFAKVRSTVYFGTNYKIDLYDVNIQNINIIESFVTNDGATGSIIDKLFSSNSKSVFKIPYGLVKSVTDLDVEIVSSFVATMVNGNITIADGNIQFSANQVDYLISYSGGVVTPTTVTRNLTNTSATLTISGAPIGTENVTINAIVTKNNLIIKSKVKTEQTDTINGTSGVIQLSKVDAINIKKVKMLVSGTYVDVTDRFVLVPNQSDNVYNKSAIVLKSGIAPVATTYKVKYDYFLHSGGDVFTADSYVGIEYSDIPSYTSTNEELFLGSCIDFRGIGAPQSVISARVSFDFYLGRTDKIVLNKYGNFSVVKGIPSIFPAVPADITDSITLYEVNIPPYSGDISKITIKKNDLKRYTMRDIGKIQKRVEQLEYVTSLSLLEADANQRELLDKFKSGFIVDDFKTQNIGDVNNIEHFIGYDLYKGELRAVSIAQPINLEVDQIITPTNVVIKNGLAMLSYNEMVGISQPLASRIERLQPYTLFNWNGAVDLNPSQDYWVTYEFKPDIIIDGGTIQASVVESDPKYSYGTVWNWWAGGEGSFGSEAGTNTQFAGISFEFSGIPFIRARDIVYTASGLKPNTKINTFFDNINVNAYCTNLITDGAGSLSGTFSIPNNENMRFKVGNRKFAISDVDINPNASSTYAETKYSALGANVAIQQRYITTRIVEDRWWTRRRDPLAQSFSIDSASGAFITSIDLYFGTTDVVSSSALVELRGMDNGYPNSDIIARKIIPSGGLTGSLDASVATRFTFDNPVYIEGGKEYCFVVISESETLTLWTSVLGEKSRRIGDTTFNSGEVIGKQPFLGSMFKSQNTTTWTAEQTQDIKFTINIAKFNNAGDFNFVNTTNSADVNKEGDIYSRLLKFDPLYFVNGSADVVVNIPDHSFIAGDQITISKEGAVALPVADNEIFKSHEIMSVTKDSVTITLDVASNITTFAGANAIRTSNYVDYFAAHLKVSELLFNTASVKYTASLTSATSGVQNNIELESNKTIEFNDNKISRSPSNRDVIINASIKTDNELISPVIDVQKTGLIAVKNRLFGFNGLNSEDNRGYVQKVINLVNPANEITVYFDAIKPADTQIYVYAKTGNGDVLSDWVQLPVDNTITDTFREFKYSMQFDEFINGQIKIVFASNNKAKTPRIKNLRVLYLNG